MKLCVQVDEYMEKLEAVMIKREDGMKLMPELYVVPGDKVDAEIKNPQSQARVPDGKIPHMWGQSLYVLAKLIKEVCLKMICYFLKCKS